MSAPWSKTKKIVVLIVAVAVVIAGYFGFRFGSMLLTWRHLDQTYEEQFTAPKDLARSLAGKRIVFHIKTGLDQDDSQICVGFNVIFAAIEAGADVTVLFDAGALLDLTDKGHNLASTRVPLRLKKVIASQMKLPMDGMPSSYREYLELLERKGAKVYANTAMLIVAGGAEKVQAKLPGYDFVQPATYAEVAEILSDADNVVVY